MKKYKDKRGLTLIEMVIVIGVITILVSMIISLTGRFDNQAKERGLKSTAEILNSALQEYYDYRHSFPDPNDSSYSTSSAALYGRLYSTPSSKKLLEQINKDLLQTIEDPNGGFEEFQIQINDPWGTELDYRYSDGDNFPKILSAGPDKVFGTADDYKL